jgi:hypothetical protein
MLKLVALDEEDLKIVSAHVQDAVMKVGDLDYFAASKQFVLPMYRFAWEKAPERWRDQPERRNSVLQFNRVLSIKTSGIHREKRDEVLALLAIGFSSGAEPAGTIELIFAGGGAARLQVECIEARLTDLGGAWQASSRPDHKA